MRSFQVSLLFWLGQQVAAHGTVTEVSISGGKTYPGYSSDFQYQKTSPAVVGWTAPLTEDQGFVPISSINSPDIICHKSATNAKLSAEVVAGQSVTLQWTPWPESHHGPMLDYLADCGADCSTVDKTTLKFFKIDGVGMTDTGSNPPLFADDDMIKAGSKWTVKIPASIKPGNYVLRHETIALHEGFEGGAQFYPQCINLKVTGSGTDAPAGVLGTQLYKAEDAGIHFDIYKKFTSTSQYTVPGPPLYSGAGSVTTPPADTSAPAPAPASPSTSPPADTSYGSGSTPDDTGDDEEPTPPVVKTPPSGTTPVAPSSPSGSAPAPSASSKGRHGRKHKHVKTKGRWKKGSWNGHDKRRVHARDIGTVQNI